MTMDYLILVYNLRVQTQININYKIKKLFKNILSNMYIDFLFLKKNNHTLYELCNYARNNF